MSVLEINALDECICGVPWIRTYFVTYVISIAVINILYNEPYALRDFNLK